MSLPDGMLRLMPVFWQWVSFVIGLVALGMALPTFIQMFAGRPFIRVAFSDHNLRGGKTLQCHIQNAPISSRMLRAIGVVRDPADIAVSFRVVEAGTQKEIEHLV